MENFVLVGLFPEVNVEIKIKPTAHSFLNDRGFLWSSYSFWQSFLDFFAGGSFAPVTNFHMFEKRKLIKYE